MSDSQLAAAADDAEREHGPNSVATQANDEESDHNKTFVLADDLVDEQGNLKQDSRKLFFKAL